MKIYDIINNKNIHLAVLFGRGSKRAVQDQKARK
jgi:hypothetical protein